jgi:dedicator of cytokinesis protein 3
VSHPGQGKCRELTRKSAADVLPGVLNRSEVVDIRYEQIAPISNALSEIAKATKTLKALIQPRTGAQIE